MSVVRLFLSCLTMLTVSVSAFAHPAHFSATEIEWNAKSQRFEVAMRLRIADLEDAISGQQKSRFRIDSNPDRAQHIQDYLQQHFAILFDGHTTCRLHWVGCELELHNVWIYFEAESIAASQADRDAASLARKAQAVKSQSAERIDNWDDLFAPSGMKSSQRNVRENVKSIHIRHAALMAVQPEQVNVVALTRHGTTLSAMLTLKEPAVEFKSDSLNSQASNM